MMRNYLRVRGEYFEDRVVLNALTELPPRARRILGQAIGPVFSIGTTSACAENTTMILSSALMLWNYLRVRGEYKLESEDLAKQLELPPRARRIRWYSGYSGADGGTTSACAENTPSSVGGLDGQRNYLRVRGEYFTCCCSCSVSSELPPRARRIRGVFLTERMLHGTTSACAENTYYGYKVLKEDGELPPRARRIHD